jgi:hypothetical protein
MMISTKWTPIFHIFTANKDHAAKQCTEVWSETSFYHRCKITQDHSKHPMQRALLGCVEQWLSCAGVKLFNTTTTAHKRKYTKTKKLYHRDKPRSCSQQILTEGRQCIKQVILQYGSAIVTHSQPKM